MTPVYKRDKNHNYLVLDAPKKLEGSEYQICMMTKNDIPHLLKCEMRMVDGNVVFFYEITGMQSVYRLFEKTTMDVHSIRKLLEGIEQAMESAGRYLLDENQLLLEAEYLYLNLETRECAVCCVPFYEGNVQKEFRNLAEYILKKLDHNDHEAVELGYHLYNKTSVENYSLSEVFYEVFARKTADEDILEEVDGDSGEVQEGSGKGIREEYQEESREERGDVSGGENVEESRGGSREKRRANKKKIGKREPGIHKKRPVLMAVLGGLGSAVLILFLSWAGNLNLTQTGGLLFLALGILLYFTSIKVDKGNAARKEQRNKWKKRKSKNGKKIPLEDPGTRILEEEVKSNIGMLVSMEPGVRGDILICSDEVRIGKGQADIVIPLDVISRVHAKITRRGDRYYLMDCTSTNGTFLNGNRIPPQEVLEMEEGDIIAFATAEYVLKK